MHTMKSLEIGVSFCVSRSLCRMCIAYLRNFATHVLHIYNLFLC